MQDDQKIFCIGFHKNGTTSLLNFFLSLSFRVCDGLAEENFQELIDFYNLDDKVNYLENLISSFRVFEDMPWPIYYKEIFYKFPNSYYILTTRSKESWIKSCLNHFKSDSELYPLHELTYGPGRGSPAGNQKEWINIYEKHNEDVIRFFSRNKSANFLHLEIDKLDNREISERIFKFINISEKNAKLKTSNKAYNKYLEIIYKTLKGIKYFFFGKKSINIFGITFTKDYSHLMKK